MSCASVGSVNCDSGFQDALVKANARWRLRDKSSKGIHDAPYSFAFGYNPEAFGEPSLDERETLSKINDLDSWSTQSGHFLEEVDWRNRNNQSFLTPVKDQNGCESCVAYAIIAVIESMVMIESTVTNIDLSEMDLYECSGDRSCCQGWGVKSALMKLKKYGVVSESVHESRRRGAKCKMGAARKDHSMKVHKYIKLNSVSHMKKWLSQEGPLITAFNAYDDFKCFWNYGNRDGIYEHVKHGKQRSRGHAVCCIGYSQKGKYWICKNSWGVNNVHNGYFRIGFDECGINKCMWGLKKIVISQ